MMDRCDGSAMRLSDTSFLLILLPASGHCFVDILSDIFKYITFLNAEYDSICFPYMLCSCGVSGCLHKDVTRMKAGCSFTLKSHRFYCSN